MGLNSGGSGLDEVMKGQTGDDLGEMGGMIMAILPDLYHGININHGINHGININCHDLILSWYKSWYKYKIMAIFSPFITCRDS